MVSALTDGVHTALGRLRGLGCVSSTCRVSRACAPESRCCCPKRTIQPVWSYWSRDSWRSLAACKGTRKEGTCLAEVGGGASAGWGVGECRAGEAPCAWPPARPSPASCCPRRPRRLSASAAPAPPPPGPCTAGSCLWPLCCLLEWEQGKDGPSGLGHPLPDPGAGLTAGLEVGPVSGQRLPGGRP